MFVYVTAKVMNMIMYFLLIQCLIRYTYLHSSRHAVLHLAHWKNRCRILTLAHLTFHELLYLIQIPKVLVRKYEIDWLGLMIWYNWKFIWELTTPEIDVMISASEKMYHSIGFIGTTETLRPRMIEQRTMIFAWFQTPACREHTNATTAKFNFPTELTLI